jgi:hypothetical protein
MVFCLGGYWSLFTKSLVHLINIQWGALLFTVKCMRVFPLSLRARVTLFTGTHAHIHNLMPILAWRKAFWKDFQLTGSERGVWRAQYPHPYNDVCAHQKIMTEYWVISACVYVLLRQLYIRLRWVPRECKKPSLLRAVTECGGAVGMRERRRRKRERGLSILFPIMHHFSVWCERDQQQRARNLSVCIMYKKMLALLQYTYFYWCQRPARVRALIFPLSALCAARSPLRSVNRR